MGKDFINEPLTTRAGIMKAPWWRRNPFIKGKIPALRTPGKNPWHKGNQCRRTVNAVPAADWTFHYTRMSAASHTCCYFQNENEEAYGPDAIRTHDRPVMSRAL